MLYNFSLDVRLMITSLSFNQRVLIHLRVAQLHEAQFPKA